MNDMICDLSFILFFFFQAEDGIRDIGVTGVQTCALPISDVAYEYQRNRKQHQQPVDRRDVDLPDLTRRRVLDLQARYVTELYGLARQGERARDDRLRGDDRRRRRQGNERIQRLGRREQVKRVGRRLRLRQQQRALSEIVQ